jgi:integrase
MSCWAEDEAHLAREHVQPLVSRVGAELAFALGRDVDLPNGHAAGLLRQGVDEPAVAGPGLEAHAGVADPRRADQFIEREVMRVDIHDDLQDELAAYRPHATPLGARHAGVPQRPRYTLRYTCIASLFAAGADQDYVAAQVGHDDVTTANRLYRYLDAAPQARRDRSPPTARDARSTAEIGRARVDAEER